MINKFLKTLAIAIFTFITFFLTPQAFAQQVECYEVRGTTCISAGLRDDCNEPHLYNTSAECNANAPCPSEADKEYDTSAECLADCYLASGETGQCTGPGNRCCYYPDSDGPIGGKEVTKETLDKFNPIKRYSSHPEKLETPGDIISFFLADFAFYLAGLILFAMLVWGGFEMIAGAADKKSLDAGKQRVTAALIGFLLLFSVYWLARILESVFNIEILF